MASKRIDSFPTGLYAHWLDGEWLKVAYPIAVEGANSSLAGIAEGGLKLHALFGTRIAISDIQLTDSEVTVRLFADPEFRKYLETDPYFLTLVASPQNDVADSDFARATSGLYRACDQPGWRTSLPGIGVGVIRRFADAIISTETVSATRALKDCTTGPGRIIAEFPEQRTLLEGILHGVSFFSRKTGGRIATQQNTSRSYTAWLREALNSPGLKPDDYGALEGVWKSITELVPDESKQYARSSVNNALEAKQSDRNKWPVESHRLWNTVVHAWNSNVCDNLGTRRSSIVPLPDACVHLGRITDVAGPFTATGGLIRKRYEGGVLSVDPTTLSWTTIREAVKKTSHLRNRVQGTLSSGLIDEYEVASSSLNKALTKELAPNARHVLPQSAWCIVALAGLRFFPGMDWVVPVLEGVDSSQSWLRNTRRKAAVFNTLHQFKADLAGHLVDAVRPSH